MLLFPSPRKIGPIGCLEIGCFILKEIMKLKKIKVIVKQNHTNVPIGNVETKPKLFVL